MADIIFSKDTTLREAISSIGECEGIERIQFNPDGSSVFKVI